MLYLVNGWILLQPDLIWWFVIMSLSILWKDQIAVVKFTVRFRISVDVCCHIFWRASPSFCNESWYGDASPWGRCSVERLVSCSHAIWYSEDSYNQNMTVPLLLPLQPNFDLLHHCNELEFLAQRLNCCVHCQAHSEGSELYWSPWYNQLVDWA